MDAAHAPQRIHGCDRVRKAVGLPMRAVSAGSGGPFPTRPTPDEWETRANLPSCPTLAVVTADQLSRAVGAEVRRLLAERGMSGNQLAKAAGLEQTGVARKLRGTGVFTLDDLAAIAPVLEVTVAELIEWAQHS